MWEFQLGCIEDLKQLNERLGLKIKAIDDVSILAEPVQAGNLAIPNSLAVHPMEGCDGDSQGRPDKLTLRRYERFAAGGAGLLWVEASAVVPEGRANPRQLWLHRGDHSLCGAQCPPARRGCRGRGRCRDGWLRRVQRCIRPSLHPRWPGQIPEFLGPDAVRMMN